MRNFCRWANKENKDKAVTVDLLTAFLLDETELEEVLQAKPQTIYEKPRSAVVNQLRSDFREFYKLCKQSCHRFVDCAMFLKYTPQQRTEAICRLKKCFTCLAPMHRASQDCRYRRRCVSCTTVLITRSSLAYSVTYN